jgi:hypothetical protein
MAAPDNEFTARMLAANSMMLDMLAGVALVAR